MAVVHTHRHLCTCDTSAYVDVKNTCILKYLSGAVLYNIILWLFLCLYGLLMTHYVESPQSSWMTCVHIDKLSNATKETLDMAKDTSFQ